MHVQYCVVLWTLDEIVMLEIRAACTLIPSDEAPQPRWEMARCGMHPQP